MVRQQALVAIALITASCASAQELRPGAIYCLSGPFIGTHFAVSKILEVEPEVVHMRLYTNVFEACPESVKLETLSWKMHDVPLQKNIFLDLNRRLMGYAAVSADEAEAVRETKVFMQRIPKP
jgi:hypothetical protein